MLPVRRVCGCAIAPPTPVGDGLWQVTAVVDNSGFLPTNLSAQAVAMHEARPVSVELLGPPGMAFVQGAARMEIGHLAGRMQRHTAYSRFYDWPSSAQAVRWTVRLPGGEAAELTVRAGCPRAGVVSETIATDARRAAYVKLSESRMATD